MINRKQIDSDCRDCSHFAETHRRYTAAGGAKILIGGEVGGLGSQNFTVWSVRGRASVPF
jgi:hypothetical protein